MQLIFECSPQTMFSYSELHLLEHVLLSRNGEGAVVQELCVIAKKLSSDTFRVDQITLSDKIVISFSGLTKEAALCVRSHIHNTYFVEVDVVREKRVLNIEAIHYDSSSYRYYDEKQDEGLNIDAISNVSIDRLLELKKSLVIKEVEVNKTQLKPDLQMYSEGCRLVPFNTWHVMTRLWFRVYVSRFTSDDSLLGSLLSVVCEVGGWYGTVYAHYSQENEISFAKPFFLPWSFVERRLLNRTQILKWVEITRKEIKNNGGYSNSYMFTTKGFVDAFAYFSDEEIIDLVIVLLKNTLISMKETKNKKP